MISKNLKFAIECVILLTLFKKSSSDKNRFSDRISLASVNGNRMNAELNSLPELQDFDTAQHTLRISGDDDDEDRLEKPIIVVLNKNEEPKIINEYSNGHVDEPNLEHDVDSNDDETIYSQESTLFNYAFWLGPKYVPLTNQTLFESRDEPWSKVLRGKGNLTGPNQLAWEPCIDIDTAFKYCKDSCKQAIRNACSDYYCKDNLYSKLKSRCCHSCDVFWNRKKRLISLNNSTKETDPKYTDKNNKEIPMKTIKLKLVKSRIQ